MERIKKAIDKARGDEPEPEGSLTAFPSAAQTVREELQHVRYQQTRVVTLDPVHLEQNRVVAHRKDSRYSIVFDRLRTQVLAEMEAAGYKSLAITSPGPGCGKTVLAINLAFSIAQKTGLSVLLANFDLRQPSMARYLGLPEMPSLTDYLEGTAGVSDLLVNPGTPRLVIMPNDEVVTRSTETLTLKQTQNLVQELKKRYASRIVIFDLPPLLVTDDALAFLPQIDCVLMVAANGVTSRNELLESQRLLRGVHLLGTVINKSDAMQDWLQLFVSRAGYIGSRLWHLPPNVDWSWLSPARWVRWFRSWRQGRAGRNPIRHRR